MIVEEEGQKVFIDSNNRRFPIVEHEYLRDEDYYESRSIGTRAKSDKCCEFCGTNISKGTPHLMHHFYPEFEAYATHHECEEPFKMCLIKD